MSKSLVIIGFGPGVSSAVAERFGAEGYSLALVARNEKRLAEGVAALRSKGIAATAFAADAADASAVRAASRSARAALGPISVIHWNANGDVEVGDLLTTDPASVLGIFEAAVKGLLSAVQEALPDLRTSEGAAVLVTNGMSGEISDAVDAFVALRNVHGLGLANAAKSKLVGLLAQRLKSEGVYVGQVTIAGLVKGSRPGLEGGIETSVIADRFWQIFQARAETRVRVS